MVAVCFCTESLIYHRYQVLNHYFIESLAEVSKTSKGVGISWLRDRPVDVATFHYDYHRHTLLGPNQIIHNVMHQSCTRPTGFVFTHTVLQIKNRITFLAIRFILCRSIDQCPSPLFGRFCIILYAANLSLGNAELWTVVIALFTLFYFNATNRVIRKICISRWISN